MSEQINEREFFAVFQEHLINAWDTARAAANYDDTIIVVHGAVADPAAAMLTAGPDKWVIRVNRPGSGTPAQMTTIP